MSAAGLWASQYQGALTLSRALSPLNLPERGSFFGNVIDRRRIKSPPHPHGEPPAPAPTSGRRSVYQPACEGVGAYGLGRRPIPWLRHLVALTGKANNDLKRNLQECCRAAIPRRARADRRADAGALLNIMGATGMTPHEIIGGPEDADLKTIRTAWHQLAKQYHPDRNHASVQITAITPIRATVRRCETG